MAFSLATERVQNQENNLRTDEKSEHLRMVYDQVIGMGARGPKMVVYVNNEERRTIEGSH